MQSDATHKSVTLEMSALYDEKDGSIRLVFLGQDGFITTVNNNTENNRGHPHLFQNLAICLKKAGAPSPVAASDKEAEHA
jgi:hypothetical protein